MEFFFRCEHGDLVRSRDITRRDALMLLMQTIASRATKENTKVWVPSRWPARSAQERRFGSNPLCCVPTLRSTRSRLHRSHSSFCWAGPSVGPLATILGSLQCNCACFSTSGVHALLRTWSQDARVYVYNELLLCLIHGVRKSTTKPHKRQKPNCKKNGLTTRSTRASLKMKG